MIKKIFTNCFLVKSKGGVLTHVCLGMKKRGMGHGLWNGAGGKPMDNETIEAAASREVEEEFGVKVNKLEKMGEISFVLKLEGKIVYMKAFIVTDWIGTPAETEEMKPQWFMVNQVPYNQMWASDREWLPIILSGKKIKAKYTYEKEGGTVESRELIEVENFYSN